jgi:beta-ribofuranosylaminobenzene 5'-phosphate synthase
VTRVEAPSRLHFGLLNLPVAGRDRWPEIDGSPGLPVRHFGGVGLMIDKPGLAVRVERTGEWSASGPSADRAIEFASRFVGTLPADSRSPFRVVVDSCAEQHVGLGVGTQLALSVAKALAIEVGHAEWAATELAARVGRGERSAIGVHGFDRGGLVVEAGKLPGEILSPLIAHHPFPDDWAVLLVFPEAGRFWHGDKERDAFARVGQAGPSPAETESLCRLAMTGILPGIAAANLDQFGEAVYEFNARVGDAFAPAQGGRYSSAAVAACVASLRALGVKGVGQSSWGPTVFAILDRQQGDSLRARVVDSPSLLTHASAGARQG